ncbi:MAG: protein kinase [Spirochaetales bacterium]|nr:protein kinase [Spirochaetales bacterium]
MEKNFILNKQYKILKKIGQGGFAETFLALDQKTQKKCVIKYLSLKKADKWKSIELFEREAKILNTIDHPFIPDFIDFFTLETKEDTKLYLVQEFIEGKNLAQLLAEGRHFTEKEVLQIALKMTHILDYLHNFSPPLIHRDIKPSNIIFVPPEKIYLIDFGAVRDKLLNMEQGGSTIIGTFGYMPIEQYEGRALPGTDIYSLGATLIHLLSHKDPALMEKKHMRIDFRPHVTISQEFTAIIEKMIEPDYTNRYQSAKELYKDLWDYSTGKGVRSFTQREKSDNKKTPWFIKTIIAVIILSFLIVPITLNEIEKAEYEKKSLEERIEQDYCTALKYITESKYEKAIDLLEKLGDYKDAKEQKIKAMALLDEEKTKAATEEEKLKRYNMAIQYKKENKYPRALSLFKSLGNYKDSQNQVKIVNALITRDQYYQAVKMLRDKEYEKALAIFMTIKDYEDSEEKIEQAEMYIESKKRFVKELAPVGGQELDISPDGKLIVYAKIYLNFLSAETGKKLKTINPHNGNYIKKIRFNPDGSILATAGGKDKSFKFWDTGTYNEIKKISIDSNAMAVDFHPDGKTIACGHGDGTITILSYPTWEKINSFKGQKGYISVLRFSKDGKTLASGNNDKTIHLWDLMEGTLLTVFEGHTSWINDIHFLSDGNHMVSGSSDETIRLWSLDSGYETLKIKCGFLINAIDPDDSGKILVCCGNSPVFEFRSIETGEKIRRLENFGSNVYSVMYTPDKKNVVTCGSDLNLWSAVPFPHYLSGF